MDTAPPESSQACSCGSLADLAVVPMGGDGLDERVFASLDETARHGDDKWWLYLSACSVCGPDWMIAQDDRIYDTFYMRRISVAARREIAGTGRWPDEFTTYEQVLRLGRSRSQPWVFLDPRSPALVSTAADLRRERPGISVEEIAYLLAIPVSVADGLGS